jgi:hypothetical protein
LRQIPPSLRWTQEINVTEPIAVCRSFEDLHRALRARAEALQIARDRLDEIAGIASGYSAKLLSDPAAKNLGPISAFPMIGALGLAVALVEDPSAMVRVNRAPKRNEHHVRNGGAHWRNTRAAALDYLTKCARQGGIARAKALTAEQRSEIARVLNLVRWQALTPKQRSKIARAASRARWKNHGRKENGQI